MSGWIKLHRTVTKKGWYKKPDYLALWVHLLLKANHSPAEFLSKGKIIKVNPGQFITGRDAISAEIGVHSSKVERILKCFESEQQIEQRKTNIGRWITIINWNQYQISEQRIEQQMNNGRTTDEQPVNTNKNDKNVNNEKNVVELATVFFNAETEILKNQIQFEKICMSTGKSKTDALASLHKYHLYLEEKEQYPKGKKAIFAGFEKWLLNEKNFSKNGSEKHRVVGRDEVSDEL